MLTYQSNPIVIEDPKKLNGHTIKQQNAKPAIFKSPLLTISAGLAGLFILLFLVRIIYGSLFANIINNESVKPNFFFGVENLPKNYTSEQTGYNNNQNQALSTAGQKYETIASLKLGTMQFDNDVMASKKTIQEFNGHTQFEQNSGAAPNRQAHFMIAVNPRLFDSFCAAIQQTRIVIKKEVTSVDKTNEYQKLLAKKASFEKSLLSLHGLKNPFDQNSRFKLQDRILELETLLLEVDMELECFEAATELCTVQFSLYESATEKNFFTLSIMKASIDWTIKYYPLVLLGILSFMLLIKLDNIKWPKLSLTKPGY